MTWSYDPALSTNKDKVRWLLQEKDADDQLVTDEEIEFALTEAGPNLYRAGAITARSIALKLGRRPTVNDRKAGIDADEQYQHYMLIAKELDLRASTSASSSGQGGVFAGGISKADKEAREADTDRVEPAFTIDLHST